MSVRHWMAAVALAVVAAGSGIEGQADQASEALQKARVALGGDEAMAKVTAIAVKGAFLREMGQRQMEGTLTLTIERPDRMHRSEEMEMPGGASVERVTALVGDTSWEDTQNRGGMGGGMVMMMRGPNGEAPNAEQMQQMRTRRAKVELSRYLLAFFAASETPLTYAGVAESPEGKADVLEIKDERGQATRLFIDQQSGLPLMMTYQDVRPRVMMGGPGGPGRPGGPGGRRGGGDAGPRPSPEEMQKRMEGERERLRAEGPPPPTTVTMFLADYKDVRGVKWPHRITESVDGKPVMEWTVEKLEVNPKIKAGFFEKK